MKMTLKKIKKLVNENFLKSTWVGLAMCTVFTLSAVKYGFGVILISLGFIVGPTACYSLVLNKTSWLLLKNRKVASLVLVAAILVVVVGAVLAP